MLSHFVKQNLQFEKISTSSFDNIKNYFSELFDLRKSSMQNSATNFTIFASKLFDWSFAHFSNLQLVTQGELFLPKRCTVITQSIGFSNFVARHENPKATWSLSLIFSWWNICSISATTEYCPKRKQSKIVLNLLKRSGPLRRLSLMEIT